MNDRKAGLQPARVAEIAISLAVLYAGLAFARYLLSTVIKPYDDEGYFLIALAHYLKEGHLYTQTYSQYGPFHFYAQEAIYRLLQLPVTHDSGRMVALFYFMASALLGGVFVYRISRSMLLGSAAVLACIRLGSPITYEPGHPQQLVLLLLMLSCCLSVSAGAGRQRLFLFLMGAVGAALAFTKINVGVFYFAALAQTLFCLIPGSRFRTAGLSCLLAYVAAAPILLMRSTFSDWSAGYCLIAVLCGAATFVWTARLKPEISLPLPSAFAAVAGAASASALIVITTLLQGMSLDTLLHGVLLDAAKLPNIYVSPLEMDMGQVSYVVFALALVSAAIIIRGRFASSSKWIAYTRCIAGFYGIFLLVHLPWIHRVLPFLPLAVIPIAGRKWRASDLLPRVFVATLAATQFLQAYPVRGAQFSIACILVLPWGFVSIADGLEELGGSKTVWMNVLGAALILSTLPGMFPLGALYPQSSLKGSTSLHLPPEIERRNLFLANNISANCNVLFTLPGMGSFHFWSGVPAPNGSNATAWLKLFNFDRQKQILDVLQSNPGACVLYNAELLNFWQMPREDLQKSPLANYIINDMPKAAEDGGYEIRINPKRTAPWIQAAPPKAPTS